MNPYSRSAGGRWDFTLKSEIQREHAQLNLCQAELLLGGGGWGGCGGGVVVVGGLVGVMTWGTCGAVSDLGLYNWLTLGV